MDFIKIENRQNWLVDIPKLHPDSTQYTLFWSDAKRKCIEGFWNKDFDGYRYMPGNLFFYVNFCRILDVDEATKTRISIKPILTDLMWELAYMVFEGRGFSGWENDTEFTSHWIVREIEKHPDRKALLKRLQKEGFKECFIDNDITKPLKKFLHPRENIRKVHNKVQGLPLYQNNAKNTMLFGCHGKEVKVKTYQGRAKSVKSIKLNDNLVGPDGLPRKVTKLYKGKCHLFKIESKYIKPYTVTSKHTLYLSKFDKYDNFIESNFYLIENLNFEKYNYQSIKSVLNNIEDKDYIKVSYDRYDNFYGFDVDADNLYLLEDDVLTHNSRGGGKMTPLDTPVLTNTGWKNMGDLSTKDKVYGRDGKLANIVGIYPQGKKQVWLVKLQDGREIECGDEHLWTVRTQQGREKVVSTIDMYKSGVKYNCNNGNLYKYQIPNCKPIDFEEKELPIHPYIVGAMLGDGTCTTGTLKIANSDNELIERFKSLLPDYEIKHDKHTTNNHTIVYRGEDKYIIDKYGANPLKRSFEKLNLNVSCKNKFIPDIYKYSSEEQRMELLRGLIDTDGSVTKDGAIEFTNTNERLIKDVADVCRSLGIRCQLSTDKRLGQSHNIKGHICERNLYYRLFINTTKEIAFLSRKKNNIKNKKYQIRHDFVSIVDIQPLEKEVEQQCISVDNSDNTYITKDYIVTHNSYFYALAVLLHEIVFDGAKYYTEDTKKKPAEVHVNIGAALSDKSAELCEKIESCMNAFATDQELGVWGDESSDDYEPMPFYKSMAGSLTPNNAKSAWRHEYEKKINGRWLKFGSGSKIVHSIYKDNPHAAAGGRYTHLLVEECGLANNLREIHGSNIATTQRGTLKFGSQHYIGTSGDLEKVKEAREMFMNPEVYDVLAYDDVWENSGKVGFFIPAYYTAFEFKDENGNTDLETAKAYYHERREQKRKAKDPTQYQAELMNYPIKPSEMFLTKKSNVLPVAELEQHRINIITNQYKGKLETYGRLIFDTNSPRGIKFIPKPKHEAFPIKSFPTPKDYSTEGELIIYEFPITESDGSVPPIYIIGYDPVHKDEEGSSLNCIHVFKTPKNFSKYGGNELVASYIGRPYAGRKPVNELAEKLAMWYGNRSRMIFFEAGGNNVKEYFEKRQKLNLLATQPTTVLTNKFSNSPTRSLVYGVPMNNLDIKMEAIGYVRDWLLQERGVDEHGRIIMNLNMINDTRLIEEMLAFDYDVNTDAVMAFAMCIVGLEETHNQYKVIEVKKTENILDFLNRSIERKYSNYNYN